MEYVGQYNRVGKMYILKILFGVVSIQTIATI